MPTDEIQKSQNGDKEALNNLLNKYRNNAYTIALKYVQVQDDAEDIVQEAFIKVFLNIHHFRNEAAFTTWLYKIVYNESIRHLSKSKKYVSIGEEAESQKEIIDEEEFKNEDYLALQQSFQHLTSNEYLIIQLYYWEAKSIKEIGLITNQTTANIKVLLHRARKKMAEFLKIHSDGE